MTHTKMIVAIMRTGSHEPDAATSCAASATPAATDSALVAAWEAASVVASPTANAADASGSVGSRLALARCLTGGMHDGRVFLSKIRRRLVLRSELKCLPMQGEAGIKAA